MYAEVKGSTLIKFPYTHGTLMEENPFTNYGNDPDLVSVFPTTETAINNGYSLVEVTVQSEPTIDTRTQKLESQLPSLKNGVWTIEWNVVSKSSEEINAATQAKAVSVRADRNNRLTECDWTQLADSPENNSAWATYRQNLRDVPSQSGFPWDVTWPNKP
jgi:methionine-rich copper-binding protein CopC